MTREELIVKLAEDNAVSIRDNKIRIIPMHSLSKITVSKEMLNQSIVNDFTCISFEGKPVGIISLSSLNLPNTYPDKPHP